MNFTAKLVVNFLYKRVYYNYAATYALTYLIIIFDIDVAYNVAAQDYNSTFNS